MVENAMTMDYPRVSIQKKKKKKKTMEGHHFLRSGNQRTRWTIFNSQWLNCEKVIHQM